MSSLTIMRPQYSNVETQLREYNHSVLRRWWQRRSLLERRLVIIATLFLALIIGLALDVVLLIVKLQQITTHNQSVVLALRKKCLEDSCNYAEEKSVCNTPECVLSAAEILKNMDDSVDPCDDFYSFACGGFEKNMIIPGGKPSVTSFSIIGDKLTEQLRTLFEQPVKHYEIAPFRLVTMFYQSCINTERIENRGLEPLREILRRFGGWPVLEGDKWDNNSSDWYEIIYKLRQTGYPIDYLFDLVVSVDTVNTTTHVVKLEPCKSAILGREYLLRGLDDTYVQAYLDYQVRVAKLLGADENRARNELADALRFEKQLAEIAVPAREGRTHLELYNAFTIDELSRKMPSIPWLDYINILLSPFHEVAADEKVIISGPEFFEELEQLLKATPKRVLANYLLLRVASSSVRYLNEEVFNLQLKFSSLLTGIREHKPRWKECVEVVSENLSTAVGSMYVRSYFKEDAKSQVLKIAADIRAVLKEIVSELEWMDPETRKRACEKVTFVRSFIAYPNQLLDDVNLIQLYSELHMDPLNYFGNRLNVSVFTTSNAFRKLSQLVDPHDWIHHGKAAVVNAFYSPAENSIELPAGILQGFLFGKDRPAYLNYAGVGWIIGHELTHGIDYQGRHFDDSGQLQDWWQPQTNQDYLTRTQCLSHGYANHSLRYLNLTIDWMKAQGETIADLGGIKEAYLAYQKWANRHRRTVNQPWDQVEASLPGLEKYSVPQLFWIGAANVWCTKTKPKSFGTHVLNKFHVPPQLRVQWTFSNMQEFAQDFNCAPDKLMNPQTRCKIW